MNETIRLLEGDCRAVLRGLPSDSVDSIVTDPPYELGFMGKGWDATGVANDPEVWRECLRVLKPGGHLLAFSGSRTYHRMVCAIEDAGLEIRDQIQWIYGSGFPKSLDVSKAIDKAAGAEREVVGTARGRGGGNLNTLARPDGNDDPDAKGCGAYGQGAKQVAIDLAITAPATAAARQWSGWGTALKPAHEPIVMARKPLIGTVAANVLAHGTGALNVDGCRVVTGGDRVSGGASGISKTFGQAHEAGIARPVGARWPANVIHDGSDEVVGAFPDSDSKGGGGKPKSGFWGNAGEGRDAKHGDTGSAARFFYSAKASKKDRGEGNNHPTVKPRALMAYLCKLVTPPGGTILDPFAGSGSTGLGAIDGQFRFIGIEMQPEYLEIARGRLAGLI